MTNLLTPSASQSFVGRLTAEGLGAAVSGTAQVRVTCVTAHVALLIEMLGDGGRNKDSMQPVQDFGCQVLQGIRADLDLIGLGFAALVYTPGCTFAAPQGCR